MFFRCHAQGVAPSGAFQRAGIPHALPAPMRNSLLELRDVVERSVTGLTSRSGVFRLGEGETLQRDLADEGKSQALASLYGEWAGEEEASVEYWEARGRDLTSLDAPSDYLAYCEQAGLAAFRHAKDLGAAARDLGAALNIETSNPRVCGDLYSLALDNGMGGCIQRTYRAALLRYRVDVTSDAHLRELVTPWASDEAEHVRFFCELQSWALGQISPQRGRNVRLSQRHLVETLEAKLRDANPSQEEDSYGSPDSETRLAIFESLKELLWAPLIGLS